MAVPWSRTLHAAAVFFLLVPNIIAGSESTVLPLKAVWYGKAYDVEMQFGGQTLPVRVDTGSADLWVAASGWKCYNGTIGGTVVPQAECFLGNGSYQPSSSFQTNNAVWLGERYGAGSDFGTVGYEDVQMGSISISQQEMSLMNGTTAGEGDAYSSGVLGLAYPLLAQIHPDSDSPTTPGEFAYYHDRLLYPTVPKRLLEMNITYWSMALQRIPLNQEIGFGGYLGFGTLPPVAHGAFVSVPVEPLLGVPLLSNGTNQTTYWATTVDGVAWGNETNSQSFQAVFDSGGFTNYLPADVANKINALFEPPGEFNADVQMYLVECNATPPANISLQIGGQMFTIDGVDLITVLSEDLGCASTVAPITPFLGNTDAIIGDPFFKNVVAVFDYGQNQMRFAQRVSNSSSNTTTTSTSGGAAVKAEMQILTFGLLVAIVMATLNVL